MRIILGVTGGIAAYKSAEIVRALRRAGAGVHVIMTAHAREFITPLTLQTLSNAEVLTGQFDLRPDGEIEHIHLVRGSDLLLVAPATANSLAKFARGVADDFLSTFYTAYTGPVVVAPAMNSRMWAHPSTRENLAALSVRGVTIVPPEAGDLACGEEGEGRLAAVETIVAAALRAAARGSSLAGAGVLVTAGPTREPIDPVRFIGNRSSGRMGYALADAARRRGARVTLVSGPVALAPPWGVDLVRVETVAEMREAVLAAWPSSALGLMAAAVGDYRVESPAARKISRQGGGAGLALSLVTTPDILSELGAAKGHRVLIGFAAQTGDPTPEARRKLAAKRCDAILANDVTREGAGFDVETNILTGFAASGAVREFPLAPKPAQADAILDWLAELGLLPQPHPAARESDRA